MRHRGSWTRCAPESRRRDALRRAEDEPVGEPRLERGEGSSCEAAPEGQPRGVLVCTLSRACRGRQRSRWALILALARLDRGRARAVASIRAMPFAYFQRLTRRQQAIYLKSDAVTAMPLARPETPPAPRGRARARARKRRARADRVVHAAPGLGPRPRARPAAGARQGAGGAAARALGRAARSLRDDRAPPRTRPSSRSGCAPPGRSAWWPSAPFSGRSSTRSGIMWTTLGSGSATPSTPRASTSGNHTSSTNSSPTEDSQWPPPRSRWRAWTGRRTISLSAIKGTPDHLAHQAPRRQELVADRGAVPPARHGGIVHDALSDDPRHGRAHVPAGRAGPLGIRAAVPAQRRARGDRGVSHPARRVAQVPARAPARADGARRPARHARAHDHRRTSWASWPGTTTTTSTS